MNINSIVQLTITISDHVVQGVDLGTPFLFGYHTAWSALVRAYDEADEMLDDGFTTSDELYKRAQKLKSQDNAPPSFKVGRRQTPLTQTLRLIPLNTTAGHVYVGKVNGLDVEIEVQSGDVLADVCDDFVTEIGPADDSTITDGTTY